MHKTVLQLNPLCVAIFQMRLRQNPNQYSIICFPYCHKQNVRTFPVHSMKASRPCIDQLEARERSPPTVSSTASALRLPVPSELASAAPAPSPALPSIPRNTYRTVSEFRQSQSPVTRYGHLSSLNGASALMVTPLAPNVPLQAVLLVSDSHHAGRRHPSSSSGGISPPPMGSGTGADVLRLVTPPPGSSVCRSRIRNSRTGRG